MQLVITYLILWYQRRRGEIKLIKLDQGAFDLGVNIIRKL
jgi:hypothetical protein